VWSLHFDNPKQPAKRIKVHAEHKDDPVSCLVWDSRSSRVYSGDKSGRLAATSVPSGLGMANKLGLSASVVWKTDSSIIQLDSSGDLVLVSSLTKASVRVVRACVIRGLRTDRGHLMSNEVAGGCDCVLEAAALLRIAPTLPWPPGYSSPLCPSFLPSPFLSSFLSSRFHPPFLSGWKSTGPGLTRTPLLTATTRDANAQVFSMHTKTALQVGTKARDGQYGACFAPHGGLETAAYAFAARPGSRVWEASVVDGSVVRTLKFKDALACDSTSLLGAADGAVSVNKAGQSLNFPRIYMVQQRFLLSWHADALWVLDPGKVAVSEWHTDIRGAYVSPRVGGRA